MPNTNNALAELAHWLECDTRTLETASLAQLNRIRKAKRIIAELSRVGFNERGQPRDEWMACEAVENCLAIAEEG